MSSTCRAGCGQSLTSLWLVNFCLERFVRSVEVAVCSQVDGLFTDSRGGRSSGSSHCDSRDLTLQVHGRGLGLL